MRQMFYQNHLPTAGIRKQSVPTTRFRKSEIVVLCIVSKLSEAILTRYAVIWKFQGMPRPCGWRGGPPGSGV